MVTFWNYMIVLGLSAIPIIELKGAIPVGISMGIPEFECFLVAVLGSMLFCPGIMLLTRRVLYAMMNSRIKLLNRFGRWQHRRVMRKGGRLEKYRIWFLLLFVAVPLPTTGVWTGSMIAGLFDIRLKVALPLIFLGNCIAGGLIWLIWGFAS